MARKLRSRLDNAIRKIDRFYARLKKAKRNTDAAYLWAIRQDVVMAQEQGAGK